MGRICNTIGCREFDLTEIDTTESTIAEFDLTDTAIMESDIQLTAKPLNVIAAPLAAVEGCLYSVTGYRATDSV